MKAKSFIATAAIALGVMSSAWAADYKVGDLELDSLWARASAPHQTSGAAYLEITNHGDKADRLVSIHSDAAEQVELHTAKVVKGMHKMRKVAAIDIPSNGKVQLKPAGTHIMFIKLKAPFAAEQEIPATLKFEHAGEVEVKFKVKPATHAQRGKHRHSKHLSEGDVTSEPTTAPM